MKLIPQNEVDEAALNDTKSIDRIDGFKAGVEFAESKLEELAIEFAEYVLKDKLMFSKELFEQFLKEII
jgi:hypothetical protein